MSTPNYMYLYLNASNQSLVLFTEMYPCLVDDELPEDYKL